MKVFVLSPDVNFSPLKRGEDRKIVTVFLEKGPEKYNFRCPTCGKIVFQYTGDLDTIFEGAVIPEEVASLDAMCHRCKVVYRATFLPVVLKSS